MSEFTNIGDCQVQLFFLGFPPGEVRPTHTHEELRLTFVRSGKMKLVVEDKISELKEGDYVSLMPQAPHSIEVISETPLLLLELVVTLPS